MDKVCSILICSCDKYSDAWELCFKSIEEYWKDCEYDIFLLTESLMPKREYSKVNTIHVKSRNWASMLHEALEKIDTDFVIFMLEDQWSIKRINQDRVSYALQYMKNNEDVAVVYFEESKLGSVKKAVRESDCFNRIPFGAPYRLSCAPGIFRKSFLYDLTSNPISPWDFERIVSFDKRGEKVRVLEIKDTNWTRIDETGAIYRGKWVPGVGGYAKKLGIQIDFSQRKEQSIIDVIKRKAKDFIFNINPELIVKIQNSNN